MINATYSDKDIVVEILTEAFDENKSFNSVIKQDHKRSIRIKKVFEYYFDICLKYGRIFLSDDKKGCAIIMYPDARKLTFRGILMDLELLFLLGIRSVRQGFSRESKIKAIHPPGGAIYYLLFIGVYNEFQNQGIGSKLLKEIIEDSKASARDIYLETYLEKNLSLYKKHGFKVYNQLDFGFPIYCLKRQSA